MHSLSNHKSHNWKWARLQCTYTQQHNLEVERCIFNFFLFVERFHGVLIALREAPSTILCTHTSLAGNYDDRYFMEMTSDDARWLVRALLCPFHHVARINIVNEERTRKALRRAIFIAIIFCCCCCCAAWHPRQSSEQPTEQVYRP